VDATTGDIVAGGDGGMRLSRETFAVPDVSITTAGDGFFVGWQDLRHVTATPPLQAIYHSGFTGDGSAWFADDRALHADVGVELGGVTAIEGSVLVLTRNSFGLGIIRLTPDR
jgi:hypothetical protein